jgi:hypothetical protein
LWHAGLPNAQWAFATFYVAVFWLENSNGIRTVAVGLFVIHVIAFGFSTRFATKILQTHEPHGKTTPDEKLNNLIALCSVVVVLVFGLGASYL